MDYNKFIQAILQHFNKTFNTNYTIIFDTRTNIINSNLGFSVSEKAGGFYDAKTKAIYIFSEIIDKINNNNYDNKNGLYNNGLAFLILSCFHELEHRLQSEHPDKLRLQYDFAKEMYSIELFLIMFSSIDPDLKNLYKNFHDNFLLEIDADTKGINNAISFTKAYNIDCINPRYYETFSKYNNYRIQNYDVVTMINLFLKTAKKYKNAINENYLSNQILNYFDNEGNLKKIDEIMNIKDSSITQYIVSSEEFLNSINLDELTEEQHKFIINCIGSVLDEHYKKKSFCDSNREKNDDIIKELNAFTNVSGTSSKTSDSIANEYYYMYLTSKLGSLKALQINDATIGKRF